MVKALCCLVASAIVGFLPAGFLATLAIAVLNYLATDGPYFPPPLVALLVVVPLALALLPFQLAGLLWYGSTDRTGLRAAWTLGALGGLVAGTLVGYVLFGSERPDIGNALIVGIGLVEGGTALVSGAYLRRWLGPGGVRGQPRRAQRPQRG
jgi:hypothetical protein